MSKCTSSKITIKNEMSNFSCEYCRKQFGANCTLRRHVRQFHEGAAFPEVRRGRKPKSNDMLVNFENNVENKEMSNFTSCQVTIKNKMSNFSCEYCRKQFGANSALRWHVRQFHEGTALPEVRRDRKPNSNDILVNFENNVENKEMSNFTSCQVTVKNKMSYFSCEYCRKQFGANSALRRHVRQFHEGAALPEVRRGRKPKSDDMFVTCNICNQKVINKKALSYHRKRKHEEAASGKQRSERRVLQFDNFTDFNIWKCHEEDATTTQFVKASGDRKQHKATVTARVYYCNRSGRYIAKDGRLRHLKTQGTCKIGQMCGAAMFVKINSTGSVTMTYYPEHRGHSCDISHIRLRREQREGIAVKLAAGIPFDQVLDSVHSSASASGINKLQFLRKQDLINIAREFGINKEQIVYKNDVDSVSEQQHDDENEHIPDVSAVSPNCPPVLSVLCKSDAIMSDVSSRRPSRDINQLMGNAELDWADIKTDVGDNRVAAQVVSEHMSRLRSLVIALGHEPETSRLPPAPPSNEPVNKLASMQGSIKSTTKQKPLRHEMTASKPSMREKEFLLRTLGGNERVISQLLSMDHDSACNLAAQDINFEHSYTKP